MFWFVTLLLVQFAAIACLANAKLFLVGLLAIPETLILVIWSYIDAFLCARKSDARLLFSKRWPRYAVGFLLLFSTPFVSPWALASEWLANHLKDRYVEGFVMSGQSMMPGLVPRDRFVIHKQAAWGRWNLVVFHHPDYENQNIILRVVGLPGERIEISEGKLLIDDELAEMPESVGEYISYRYHSQQHVYLDGQWGAGCNGNPITLGENEYYLLGDNSRIARDSRLWETPVGNHQLGALPRENIKGTVTAIYWPPDRVRSLR